MPSTTVAPDQIRIVELHDNVGATWAEISRMVAMPVEKCKYLYRVAKAVLAANPQARWD
jgi:hypothetical protein